MGSEGRPRQMRIHLTGFKKFHNVTANPTEELVEHTMEFMKDRPLPLGVTIERCTVMETAGLGCLDTLQKYFEYALFPSNSEKLGETFDIVPESWENNEVVWVHLGVDSGASRFAIEQRAVNEATFRCPDEMGWKPNREPIAAEDGAISNIRQTKFDTAKIVADLVKQGFNVVGSNDAGRFVCNYVYYQSLKHAAEHGTKSLFVHVPLFSVIDRQTQLEFIAALLNVLASPLLGSVRGTRQAKIHVTGFKKFHNVAANPSEELVERTMEFMKDRPLPLGATIEGCTVLETAGLGCLNTLLKLFESALLPRNSEKLGGNLDMVAEFGGDKEVVWVHLGVDSGASRFAVEQRAVNEATFRCPDEFKWQPDRIPIAAEDGAISNIRQTKFDTVKIVADLVKQGFNVVASNDAGRFVCNYVYYQSLKHAAEHGTKSLFVHVPLFSVIDRQTQLEFLAALLKVLASSLLTVDDTS